MKANQKNTITIIITFVLMALVACGNPAEDKEIFQCLPPFLRRQPTPQELSMFMIYWFSQFAVLRASLSIQKAIQVKHLQWPFIFSVQPNFKNITVPQLLLLTGYNNCFYMIRCNIGANLD